MTCAIVTGVKVTVIPDVGDEFSYVVHIQRDRLLGHVVLIGDGSQVLSLDQNSWQEVKGIVDELFENVEGA